MPFTWFFEITFPPFYHRLPLLLYLPRCLWTRLPPSQQQPLHSCSNMDSRNQFIDISDPHLEIEGSPRLFQLSGCDLPELDSVVPWAWDTIFLFGQSHLLVTWHQSFALTAKTPHLKIYFIHAVFSTKKFWSQYQNIFVSGQSSWCWVLFETIFVICLNLGHNHDHDDLSMMIQTKLIQAWYTMPISM